MERYYSKVPTRVVVVVHVVYTYENVRLLLSYLPTVIWFFRRTSVDNENGQKGLGAPTRPGVVRLIYDILYLTKNEGKKITAEKKTK